MTKVILESTIPLHWLLIVRKKCVEAAGGV
jgi:hypothetical protein